MPTLSQEPTANSGVEARYFWAILGIAAAIRFYNLGGKQLWVDEIIQAIHSSPQLSLAGVLRSVTDDRGATPLDYIIQHYVSAALGQSEFILRLPAAVFGIVTIAAIYFLFRTVLGSRAAVLSAGLYAVYPLHHHYSQEGRPYALFTLLTVCSYLTFCKTLERGRSRDWLLYGVTNTALLYSQYFGMFVLASQLLFSMTMLSGRVSDSWPLSRKIGFPFLAAQMGILTASALLFVPWLVFGIHTISGYAPQPVHFGFKLFLSFIQGLGDGSHPLAWILILLAVLGARKLMAEKRYALLSLLLCWCVMPVPLIFLLLWIKEYFFAIRHFLFITPALFALVSLGIGQVSEMLAARYAKAVTARAAVALVVCVSLLVIGLHVPDRREDLRGAGTYLNQNVRVGDQVIAPAIDGVLSYYFPQIGAHSRPSDILATPNGMAGSGGNTFIVETAYLPASDRQIIESGLGDFPSKRQIHFRDVEIIEVANRR
jgi:mannosyltransferase